MGDSAFEKVPTINIIAANITLEIGGTEMSKHKDCQHIHNSDGANYAT
jgi:hypothetical protein